MSAPKRIVCYAINGSGLGHVTRLIAVARWLRRFVALLDQRPPEVIFLTSSDASDALAQAGFAAFKIPSKTVATKTELDKLEYRRLAKHFVWNTLGVFSPDLLVVDTFPAGSFDELFQVLDGPFKKGFIYRSVRPEYAARATFRSAIGLYDAVVVPHGNDRASSEPFAPEWNARFCGEVVQFERDELIEPLKAREQLGIAPHRRLIYVSAGGGGDPLAEATLTSVVKTLQQRDDLHLLVGAGPLYRGQRLSGPTVTWFDAPRVWRYFSALDAAVCAAGYNTFHELIYAQVPTVFFAQTKIADDQARRIVAAKQAGACRQIADISDEGLLIEHVRALLDSAAAAEMRDACSAVISGNGARHCAVELLRPLYDAFRLEWASRLLTPRLTHSLERVGNGTTGVLADWLTPLMPRGQMDTLTTHPGLDDVLSRLSVAAAEEVNQILLDRHEALDQSEFENGLVALLNAIDASRRVDRNGGDVAAVADDVRKTLVGAMKKQPLAAVRNGHRTRWVCALIAGVHKLTKTDFGLPVADVLGIYRMFPRIVDADANEAFDEFTRFLQQRLAASEPTHEIMRQLQVFKLAHPRVTRATLETLYAGTTT